MQTFSIPYISDNELMRRYLKTKPIAEFHGVKYWLRDYSLRELKTSSYIWYVVDDRREPVGNDLSNCTYRDIECLHTYGFPGFFKPTISEILAQIPEDIFEHYCIDAFEIIDWPVYSTDFDKHREAFNAGFHTSTVRLYIRALPWGGPHMIVLAIILFLFFIKWFCFAIWYLAKRNYKGFILFVSGAILWLVGAILAFCWTYGFIWPLNNTELSILESITQIGISYLGSSFYSTSSSQSSNWLLYNFS